jgi:ABC-type sugar transport system ATPase subunit
VRGAAAGGAGVVFVSHRLDEVMDLADRVVVLRDGRVVADAPVSELDHAELVRLIVGAALDRPGPRERRRPVELALDVRGLAGGRVRDVDLHVRAGEVVGISGILGSGREHVAPLLFGALPRNGGDVSVGGDRLLAAGSRAAIQRGAGLRPRRPPRRRAP